MLVLTRQKDEKIEIGDDIVITIVEVRGGRVRVGIEAPRGIPIKRDDVASSGNGEKIDNQHTGRGPVRGAGRKGRRT